MTHRRPPRLASFDYLGCYRYFVTCCTFTRMHYFVSDDRVEIVRDQIVRTCEEKDFDLLAMVFMPDHLHLLVEGTCEDSAFKPTMTLLRQRTAMVFNRQFGKRLWQDGYYEHVLREDENTDQVIGYIADNPVRKKLVQDPAEYRYFWCKYELGGLRLSDEQLLRRG